MALDERLVPAAAVELLDDARDRWVDVLLGVAGAAGLLPCPGHLQHGLHHLGGQIDEGRLALTGVVLEGGGPAEMETGALKAYNTTLMYRIRAREITISVKLMHL